MWPKVSIQIPTYNQQQYISRTIKSALMQDYPNIEVIVADDQSQDDTERVVKNFSDNRLRYFKNEKNIGRVANYRKALYEYCTGEWVVNLDGDDFLTDPSFISRGMELINSYKQQGDHIVFYQTAISIYNENTGEYSPRYHSLLKGKEHDVYADFYSAGHYRKNKFFSHLTAIYDRAIAMKVGFYEFNTLSTDFESMMKLSFHGKAILDNRVCGAWSYHGGNATFKLASELGDKKYPVFDRLTAYAKSVYGDRFYGKLERDLRREKQILHLELLAEHHDFITLLKYLFTYRMFYHRIPIVIAKAAVNNVKKLFDRK